MSLTTRILLVFLLIAALGWRFLFEPVMDRVERQYLEAAEEPMVDTAEILAAIISQHLERQGSLPDHLEEAFQQVGERELEARIYSLLKTRIDMEMLVTDERGIVVFDSRGSEFEGRDLSRYLDISRTLLGHYGARSTRTNEADESSSIMHVGAPVMRDGRVAGVVSVSKPQASMFAFIEETRNTLRMFALLGVAGFLSIGILLSRWVTHPLRVLTRHAAAVAGGSRQLAPKLPGRHLRKLGDSIEEMRNALEDRNYVESYVQTLTHEMKGPVAAIRGAAEILGEDPPAERRQIFADNILSESHRLQQLIERLLALAALENRKRLETPQRVSLAEITARVAEESRSRLEPRGATIRLQQDTEGWVMGEQFLLETALRNLISNAEEFIPEHGGLIEIDLQWEGEWIALTVRDNGPGIPDYALPRVFQHFYSLPRPSNGRKSSGLGLCFVRECCELHGGTVELENREQGGTCARIRLPAL